MHIFWHRPLVDGSCFPGVHLDAILTYNVTKKLQLRLVELTF